MRFSPPWRIIACALTSLSLAILAGLQINRKEKSSSEPVQSSEERRIEPAESNSTVSAPLRDDPSATPILTESPASTAATLESIEAAESPAALEPYLSSSVLEVRAAAVDAMIRLGDSSAVPMLEVAARTLPAEEAAPLLDAARFLALPDASDLIAGKTAAPQPREMGGRKPLSMRNRKRDAQPVTPNGDDQSPPR
jgi:hypothetical protein